MQSYPSKPFKPGFAQTEEGQEAFLCDLAAWGSRTLVLSGIRLGAGYRDARMGTMSFFRLDGNTSTAHPALNAILEGALKPLKKSMAFSTLSLSSCPLRQRPYADHLPH